MPIYPNPEDSAPSTEEVAQYAAKFVKSEDMEKIIRNFDTLRTASEGFPWHNSLLSIPNVKDEVRPNVFSVAKKEQFLPVLAEWSVKQTFSMILFHYVPGVAFHQFRSEFDKVLAGLKDEVNLVIRHVLCRYVLKELLSVVRFLRSTGTEESKYGFHHGGLFDRNIMILSSAQEQIEQFVRSQAPVEEMSEFQASCEKIFAPYSKNGNLLKVIDIDDIEINDPESYNYESHDNAAKNNSGVRDIHGIILMIFSFLLPDSDFWKGKKDERYARDSSSTDILIK